MSKRQTNVDNVTIPKTVALIPLRNNRVVLPGVVLRLNIGRSSTVSLIEQLWNDSKDQRSSGDGLRGAPLIGCVPLRANAPSRQVEPNGDKKKEETQAPGKDLPVDAGSGGLTQDRLTSSELHNMGCVARILAISKVSGGPKQVGRAIYSVTVEGLARFKVNRVVRESPYFEAEITGYPEASLVFSKDEGDNRALDGTLRTTSHDLANILSQMQLPPHVVSQLRSMIDGTPAPRLADMVASMIDLTIEEKLSILDTVEPKERIDKVLRLLTKQVQVLKISKKLQSTVEGKLGEKQREFILREQLNAIKQELGEKDEEQDEVEDLARRLQDANLPPEPAKIANRELRRLKRMHPSMAEYQVVRTYLETLSELPWNKETPDVLDIEKARQQLNHDHYGLDKIKSRILEFLAVRKLKKDLKGPILCLLGPPGVGKTSLGRSIAAALGRQFHRISLGGVRDEAEIRGHRRTYIGAMPGLIIQGLRRCGVNNPVILLDEIDKLGRDFRGDPSSALLEVLDPEQNGTFQDHYVNTPFDLSKVLFIATANEESTIPGPLLDRMEVIRIPGYTFEEKLHIARRYLLPKQVQAHGLTAADADMTDTVLTKIATGYTREAGVRNLEREVATVCRSMAVEYAESKETGKDYDPTVTMERLEKILGVRYHSKRLICVKPDRFDDEVSERTSIPGVVTGLAWTASGAGGLLFIEATITPGKGQIQLTGKLGDVIKESAQIALTWVKAHAAALNITKDANAVLLEKNDVHIHFPSGAIPKDGPSAGVTIATSLVSLFTNKPAKDHTAMTGEITLRGQVLPVGGIKEKVLAAHRGGIRHIILPFRNRKDLMEIPQNVKDDIQFVFAKNIGDVLSAAFDHGQSLSNAVQALESNNVMIAKL